MDVTKQDPPTSSSSDRITLSTDSSGKLDKKSRSSRNMTEELVREVFVLDIYTRFDLRGKSIKWKRHHPSLDKNSQKVFRREAAALPTGVSQASPAFEASESVTGAYFEITISSLKSGFVLLAVCLANCLSIIAVGLTSSSEHPLESVPGDLLEYGPSIIHTYE